MSQYLHFCLVPEKDEKELVFATFSRSTDVYSMFNDSIHIPFRMQDEYTVLDKEKANIVLKEAEEDINKSKNRLNLIKECYNSVNTHTTQEYDDYVEEYTGLVEYINDLEGAYIYVKHLLDLFVYELVYSDFKEVRMFIG